MESSESKETKLENIMNKAKLPHNHFHFFLYNSNKEGSDGNNLYFQDFLCLPKLPILGQYNKNSYDMSEIISLVTFKYNLNNEEENVINLPIEVVEYIKNLSSEMIANNTKSNHVEIPAEPDIKFYWVCIENTLIENNSDLFNIVPHTFLIDELDFSKTKRITFNYPIGIFVTEEMKSAGGLKEFTNEHYRNNNNKNFDTGITFNKLRIEYSSIHLIKYSLGFSPNNLKFYLVTNNNVSDFFLIILKDKTFHIFYYWIVNEKNSKAIIKKIFSDSQNLNQLFIKLDNSFGYENEKFLQNLKSLFKNFR